MNIKLIDKLFFYSSRQIIRRRRSYSSVFITSVVLLTCVMTFLEMSESFFLKNVQQNQWGTHHAIIRGMYNDFTDEIDSHKRVESSFAIPYTSLLESSEDTSIVGRVCVDTPEIDDYLNVNYIWGSPPEDGEIAVSEEMYIKYGYLSADKVNDLYFTSSTMTYYPLKISGIYECSDADAGYVFVSQNTSDAIAAETGAKVKYDIYFRCKNSSDRYVSQVLNDIYKMCKFPDTEWQSRDTSDYSDFTPWGGYLKIYADYINHGYMNYMITQEATPVIMISLPVIAIAAVMLASFVGNWMISNSPEYGVLGAIGANRRQLCAISAGQVLFISLLASVPVIILSAGISNIYISVYNAASSNDIDYVFRIPWIKLIQASLWFDILACFFTYLTISKLTREYPFVLISGSFRASYPFVKSSAYSLEKSRDKIRKLSIVRAMRNIRSEIVTAIVTSFICIVCGAFFLILIIYKSNASAILSGYTGYAADMSISVRQEESLDRESLVNSVLDQNQAMITRDLRDFLMNIPEVESVGAYSKSLAMTDTIFNYEDRFNIYTLPSVISEDSEIETYSYRICDENILPLLYMNLIDGDPNNLFEGDDKVVIYSAYDVTPYSVGDKITISAGYTETRSSGKIEAGKTCEYTVAAIVSGTPDSTKGVGTIMYPTFIFSFDGGERIGYCENGEATTVLVNFDDSFSYDQIVSSVDSIVNNPDFLRFDITTYTISSTTEKKIEATNTVLISLFIFIVYISFCVMTFSSSSLKVTKTRREIAITRQLGADNRAVYKSMRTETYPTSLLALIITVALAIVVVITIISYGMSNLNIQAQEYPLTYTPEFYAECKAQIMQTVLLYLALFSAAIPMHLISSAVAVIGTVLPTKRILRESITEGIRKDTD